MVTGEKIKTLLKDIAIALAILGPLLFMIIGGMVWQDGGFDETFMEHWFPALFFGFLVAFVVFLILLFVFRNSSKNWIIAIIGATIVCVAISIGYMLIFDNPNADSHLTPVSEPASGTILSGSEVYNGSEITIHAASEESCVVKLKTSSGTEVMSFFVRAGDTVTVRVPRENLYVYFASGDTWYGNDNLFGSKTYYSMDDEIRDFTKHSWEYTRYKVSNGNFSETPIDEDKFK